MDNYADDRDYRLLENDRYTFSVLRRIIDKPCELLLSDHEKLILCYSGSPYPVWIWTPDHTSAEEMDGAYSLAQKNGLFDGSHHFNVKYELAEHFIKRSSQDNRRMSITLNMFAYDCLNPIKPNITVDGEIHRCTSDDIEEMTELISMFHEETGAIEKAPPNIAWMQKTISKTGMYTCGKMNMDTAWHAASLRQTAIWLLFIGCLLTPIIGESIMLKILYIKRQ